MNDLSCEKYNYDEHYKITYLDVISQLCPSLSILSVLQYLFSTNLLKLHNIIKDCCPLLTLLNFGNHLICPHPYYLGSFKKTFTTM
jgi:hypothetical protein